MITAKKYLLYVSLKKYLAWRIKSFKTKNEYLYLYKKDDELKPDNFTAEDEGIIQYSNDFLNCKIIHDRDST